MKFYLNSYIRVAIVLGLLLSIVSCSEDLNIPSSNENDCKAGNIYFACGDMIEVYNMPHNPASRAGGSKTPEEKAINTLHVFFFYGDENDVEHYGMLLKPNDYDNFKSYQKISNATFIPIPNADLFKDPVTDELLTENALKKIKVVAIANIDATEDALSATDDANMFRTPYNNGKIQKDSRASLGNTENTYIIEKYSDLLEWIYFPRIRMSEDGEEGSVMGLPEAGMPMIGEDIIDLTDKSGSRPIINLIALMAKVNVSIDLDPDEGYYDTDTGYPTLSISEYGVRNMPVAIPFTPHTGKPKDENGNILDNPTYDKPKTYEEYISKYDVTMGPMFHKGKTPTSMPDDEGFKDCNPEDHEFTTKYNVTINKDSPVISFSYYTYENINLPNYDAERADNTTSEKTDAFDDELNVKYPPGVKEEDYQRWKSTIAYPNRASALVLKGEFTTHQGLKYNAQFTVYLGNDTDKDFMVKRNHRYDNNITIKGLEYIRNSTDNVFNFDGRVNVVSDNLYYLAIFNERKVDAHASALPMDIWLMDWEDSNVEVDYNTDISFEIPESDQNWIQMVFIPREEMENNAGRFIPGTGIEDYFYTNLLDDISERDMNINKVINGGENGAYRGHIRKVINGLEYGAHCGSKVVMRSTPEYPNSRSRIYFYIDENTKDFVNDVNDSETPSFSITTGTRDRSTKIKVKYKSYKLREGSLTDTIEVIEERFRDIEIEQRGLRRVQRYWTSTPDGDGNVITDTNIQETFIEYYEEYLSHNDPLEERVSGEVYEGLEWGLNGIDVNYRYKWFQNNGGFENPEYTDASTRYNGYAYNIYYKTGAFKMTQWAIEKTQDTDPMKNLKLFNIDTTPASAFHYCYGKNKRNYDGSVVVTDYVGWYMPGIRELETALVQYYETFKDFQKKFYWSAACGPYQGDYDTTSPGGPGPENRTHARATSVSVENGKPKYENSSSEGDNGYRPRIGDDGVLRIRAFYTRKAPQ